MESEVRNQAIRFGEITKQINGIYEAYAKSVGLNYTSLHILHMVLLTDNCTQKSLCEQLLLPKQTIHSVVMSFTKQGIMKLIELPEDKRHKSIHMTEKGIEYASQILPRIDAAETNSMEKLDAAERIQLLRLMEKYTHNFSAELR